MNCPPHPISSFLCFQHIYSHIECARPTAGGTNIIRGSHAARAAGLIIELDPSCCRLITVRRNIVVMPMHIPMARKTLWLSRRTTRGRPRNKSVISSKGWTMREWTLTRTSAPKPTLLLFQPGDQLGGRGEVFEAHSAGELLEIEIAGDKALVGLEPVGPIMWRDQHGPAGRKEGRPRIEMFWLADFIE